MYLQICTTSPSPGIPLLSNASVSARTSCGQVRRSLTPHENSVYGVLIVEWIQTGLLTTGSFEVFVYNYGNVSALVTIYNGWF